MINLHHFEPLVLLSHLASSHTFPHSLMAERDSTPKFKPGDYVSQK